MLLKHFKPSSEEEKAAVEALKDMVNAVADVKKRHSRPALLL